MILHTVDQRSPSWGRLRAGIPTASEFASFLKDDFTLRDSAGLQTYMNRKIAERKLGRPILTFSGSGDTEQGNLKESDAYPWFALEYGVPLRNDVFCTTDDGKAGCSPDGLWVDGYQGSAKLNEVVRMTNPIYGGVEIKCPATHTHIGYLRAGVLPKEYRAQVHGSIYVTGAQFWYFVSYHQDTKFGDPLVVKVERDEALITQLADSLAKFNDMLDREYERLSLKWESDAVVVLDDTKRPINLWKRECK